MTRHRDMLEVPTPLPTSLEVDGKYVKVEDVTALNPDSPDVVIARVSYAGQCKDLVLPKGYGSRASYVDGVTPFDMVLKGKVRGFLKEINNG